MIKKFSGPQSTNGKLNSVNGSFKKWLKETFRTVKAKIASFSSWNKSDVSKFLTELKENASNDKNFLLNEEKREEKLIEIIAVVARASEICTGFKQRNNQFLALLLRIYVYLRYPEMRGLVMQVDTGQGKSIIIAVLCAVLAIWKSLEKAAKNPNQDEAEGDELKNKKDFFEMLGLTVDHLSYEHHEEDKIKNAYATADVVYAHMYDCLSHAALDEFYSRDIRGGRMFDHLFIDENDFEQCSHEYFFGMYYYSCENSKECLNSRAARAGAIVEKVPWDGGQEAFQEKIVDNAFASDSNAHPEEKKCQIQFEDLMAQLPAKIPEFLKEYARKEAERWADSAINALSLVDRVQFIRQSANSSRTDLIPVDNENTGIVEQNTQWEDGLHQFAQILQFVSNTPLTMQSATKDNLCFIRDQKEVTGITGTIGNEQERKFIEETFNVLTIVVPPFTESKLIRERNAKQPVLVVCGSVREAERIIDKIEMELKHIKIRKLLKGDEVEEDPDLVKKPIGPGEIMVATKLGCRGMDLPIAKETLKARLGLLTINATASETPRNETQTVGRSGRKGEPGEGITIVCIPELEALLGQSLAGKSKEEIGHWRKIRDERIAKNLDSFSKHRVDPILLRAHLYGEMCKEMKIFREMCINVDYTEFALLQIEQHWAFWIKDAARKLDDEIKKAIKESPEKHASEIVGPMKVELVAKFDKFIDDIKRDLEQFIKDPEKLDLFENPAYVVKTADYFLRNDNPELAERMLTTAFNMDKVFGAYALYYRALSYIERGHKLFVDKNKRTKKNDLYHQKAREDLSTAICLVQDMIYYINGASITIQRPTSELALQYNRKPPSTPPDPADPDPAGGSPHPKSPKDRKDNSSNQDPSPFEVKIPFDEINEMKDSGFPHFFELGVAAPKPPWWSIIILAVVGIMQICLGAMLAVCSGGLATRFAATCIQSGFSDMVTAIKEAIDGIRGCTEGAFSWMKWLGRKSIEYGGALLGHVAKFLGEKSSLIAKTNKLVGIGQPVVQTPATKIIRTVAFKTFKSEGIRVEKGQEICLELLDEKVTKWTNGMDDGFFKELITEGSMKFGNNALNGVSEHAKIIVNKFVDELAKSPTYKIAAGLMNNSKSHQDEKETDRAKESKAQDEQNDSEAKPSSGDENKNDQDEKETDGATKNKDQQSSNDEKTNGTKKDEGKADQQSSSNGQPSENTDATKKDNREGDQQSSKKGQSSENAEKVKKKAKYILNLLNMREDAQNEEAAKGYHGSWNGKNILKPEEEKANPCCEAFIRHYVLSNALSKARKYSRLPFNMHDIQLNRIQGKIGESLYGLTRMFNPTIRVYNQVNLGHGFGTLDNLILSMGADGKLIATAVEVKTTTQKAKTLSQLSRCQTKVMKWANSKEFLALLQKKFPGVEVVKHLLVQYRWPKYFRTILRHSVRFVPRIGCRLLPVIGWAMLAYDGYCVAEFAFDKYQKYKAEQIKTERVSKPQMEWNDFIKLLEEAKKNKPSETEVEKSAKQ
ncbi:protein translocase subunit SecA 1 [Ditylenchus destructor]|nr:protein translocase subunit SecA 1 [Ditylenchus destructor]